MVDGPDDAGMAAVSSSASAWVRSREPSLTAMISNVSAMAGQAVERLLDEALDVRLLVVGREEEGEARRRASRGPVGRHWRGLTTADDPGEHARVEAVELLEDVALGDAGDLRWLDADHVDGPRRQVASITSVDVSQVRGRGGSGRR